MPQKLRMCSTSWEGVPVSEAHGTWQLAQTAATTEDRWWEAQAAAAAAYYLAVEDFQHANIKFKPLVGDLAPSDEITASKQLCLRGVTAKQGEKPKG